NLTQERVSRQDGKGKTMITPPYFYKICVLTMGSTIDYAPEFLKIPRRGLKMNYTQNNRNITYFYRKSGIPDKK
ncbi:MAG TPA: hypothetical protein VK084_03995, partial [Chitinophagaceae bacterium]|nr:hypothetical protein [Chitinophagaceae bacterium]